MIDRLRTLVEYSAFGVCSYLGEKIGIASYRVRLFFIYITFVAMGSPILIYLFVAFWMNIKQYLRQKRHAIWDA